MAVYNFRILLETVEGNKTSYYSSSFVNTDNNPEDTERIEIIFLSSSR